MSNKIYHQIIQSIYGICFTSIIILNLPDLYFSQTLVVGYYPDFIKSSLPYNKIHFQNLTHIVHAFIWPTSSGELASYSNMVNPNLNKAVHDAGKKILIALGGWGQSEGFAHMSADSGLRTKFVNEIIEFISLNQYDGIDIDWEFPENDTQRDNLTRLVEDLRKGLDEIDTTLLLTMAVSSGDYYGKNFDFEKLEKKIDWFALMSYDFHGSWSTHTGHNAPLYAPDDLNDGSADQGIKYLNITRKIPKDKILLGVPFYGKEFNASGLYNAFTGSVSDLKYSEIAQRLNSEGWEYNWDIKSSVPYLLNSKYTKFITFDDTASIKIKCEYIKENNLMGAMIWAVGQDVVGNSQPLLKTVGETLELSIPTGLAVSDGYIISQYKLLNNYPNPFNPVTVISYKLSVFGHTTLKIYDMLGREIATLVNEEQEPGSYQVKFDAGNLPGGVYFYTLITNEICLTKKMIYLK